MRDRSGRPSAPVAINARAAVRGEIGGVERLAREMVLRLPALRPDRYRVVRPRPGLAHRTGHLWEQAALPILAAGAEVVYSPANLAPLAASANVVVIHDAAALRCPEAYTRPYVAYQRRILPLIARRARLVITVSEFSRGELVEALGVDPERVRVIAEGVDARFSADVDPEPARARYGLTRPYVLVVGTVSARKNLGLVATAAGALEQHGVEVVVAGSGRRYIRGVSVPLRRLGYVPEEHLPGLYRGARALAMPSRYEGFGLPCLEAMACGLPVVAAARGALPEVTGGAAMLADPDDAGGFAAALIEAACDEGLRRTLSAAGRRRAAAFSWERTARLTDAVLGGLVSESAGGNGSE